MDAKPKAEHWLYVSFIASLPFATLFPLDLFGASVQFSDLIFLAAAVVWAFSVLTGRSKLRWSWFYVFLAAYAVSTLLSTVTSIDPSSSSIKLAGKFYLIAIPFLTFNLITSAKVLKRVLQGWFIGSCILLACCLAGIIFFYTGLKDPSINLVLHPIFGSLPTGNYPRIEGFFLYPAILCNFLGMTWMFALLLTSAGWLRLRSLWLFAPVLFIVDIFTVTPGLGGILLVTGIFLATKLLRARWVMLARAILSGGTAAALIFLAAASITLFSYSPNGVRMPLLSGEVLPSHRAIAWQTAFETFSQNPIFGRGIGMPVSTAIYTDPSGTTQLLADAHNTYLSVAGETGIVGIAAFFSVIGFVTLRLFRWKAVSDPEKTARLCLLLAMLDAFFYQSLSGSYEDMRHLWVLVGVIAAVTHGDYGFFSSPTVASLTSVSNLR